MLYKVVPDAEDDWYKDPYEYYIVFIPGESRRKFTGSIESSYYIDCRDEIVMEDAANTDCDMVFAYATATRLSFYN